MDIRRNVDTSCRRLGNEIIIFYVAELTLARANSLMSVLSRSEKELLPNDRAKLDSLKSLATRKIEEIFRWIREYLVYAVNSELENQDFLPKKLWVELPAQKYPKELNSTNPVDKFIMFSTTKQIVKYLRQASKRFRKKGWHACFGGEKWATIADIAVEMWTARIISQKCLLIDRTFQIEHNGGMIFDKRSSRVVPNEPKDKKILDFKRRSKDVSSLITGLKKRATNQKTKLIVSRLASSIRALEKCKTKKALSGD